MIEVPETVKRAFEGDPDIQFRVHFPNGEREDITNDMNIVSESISFKESLCKNRYLKFGLTESSSVRFNMMGVENIIGREIECAYDVYSHTMVGKDIYVSNNTGWYPANPESTTYVDCNTLYYDSSQIGDYQRIADVRDCYIYYSKPMSYSGEGMIPGYANTLYAGDICKYHREHGEFEKINPSEKLIEAIKSVQGGDAVYMLFKTPDGAYYGQVGWWYNPEIDGEETDIIYFGDEVMSYITYEDVIKKEGSVPLGRFTVKSCPRNHENMTRRKVTAYSAAMPELSNIEKWRWNIKRYGTYGNGISLKTQDYIAANAGMRGFEDLYTASAVSGNADTQSGGQLLGIKTDEDTTYFYFIGGMRIFDPVFHDYTLKTIVFSHNVIGDGNTGGTGESGCIYKIRITKGADYDTFMNLLDSLSDDGMQLFEDWFGLSFLPFTGGVLQNYPSAIFLEPDKDYFVYAYDENTPLTLESYFNSEFDNVSVFYNTTEDYRDGTIIGEYEILSGIEITKYKNTTDDISLLIKPTGEGNGDAGKYYLFIDALDYTKMLNGWLELNALFGKCQRDGSYALMHLSKDNPIEISKDLIRRLWWDEYDVSPIGSVKYSFKTGSEQQIAVYQFGSGKSEYDMTGNYVLLNMDNASMSNINTLLDQLFIPNIGDIGFTPVDLTMKGLPYAEAGDFLRIIVKDDTEAMESCIVQSYQGYVATFELPSAEIGVYESKIQQVKVDEVVVTDYSVYTEQSAEDSFTLIIAPTGYTSGTVTLLYGEREVVETYVMQRSLSGIQSLTDDIESSGGEIIESEVIEDES